MKRKISTSLILVLTLVLPGFALRDVLAQASVQEPRSARSAPTEAAQSAVQPAAPAESQAPAKPAQPERAPRPPLNLDNPPGAELLERIEQAIEASRATIPKARNAELLYGESLKQLQQELDSFRDRIPLIKFQELPDSQSLRYRLQARSR